jgi:hypothetical protein
MASVLAATPAVHVSRFDVGGSRLDTGLYGACETTGSNRPMVEDLSVAGVAAMRRPFGPCVTRCVRHPSRRAAKNSYA